MTITQQHPAFVETYSADEVEHTYRKIALRLMPFLIICYIVSYLDRANISFAKLQFMSDLGFSETAYGLGAGLFFVGYVLFEVPSNLWMQRIGARRTLLRIMILWGLISSAMMFVNTPTQFYVMRFFLGAAEAGFFPGVIFYLTYWFPASRRGRVTGFFMMGAATAGIIGGPLSTWIMVHMADLHGLRGWQWLFLLEGLPAVFLGVIAFYYLCDKPGDATWLSAREKAIVRGDLAAEEQGEPKGRGHGLGQALRNPKLYVGMVGYFCVLVSFNAIGFWAPTIIRDVGVTDLVQVGLLSSVVFLAGAAGTYVVGYSSDIRMERRWHLLACGAVIALCFALLPLIAHNITYAITLLSLAAAASYGGFVVFWTIPATFLTGNTKASGIALITSLGGIGAFVSPTLVGWMKSTTGSIYAGLGILGVITLIGAVIILVAIPANKGARHA
ncbi:MFS transporter [Pseudomonas sp. JQ170]|uniref:MFS transporter n=1 Tax=unclassified Pseudomonas TaxID=196821 RepID=UPI00264FCB4A|nr:MULTISPECIES: MFS transporter [unclassified Pseudomonas]MDN7140045.1 MFS transporter [Pseudomonas sp. JQ170]WRO78598.1 MFS transporter [Pseudomonas sp. 170C]